MANHLMQIQFNGLCDRLHWHVVYLPLERIFQIDTDLIEGKEHEAYQRRAKRCEIAQVWHQSKRQHEAENANGNARELTVLPWQRRVFDTFQTALRTGQRGKTDIQRCQTYCIDQTILTGFTKAIGDISLQCQGHVDCSTHPLHRFGRQQTGDVIPGRDAQQVQAQCPGVRDLMLGQDNLQRHVARHRNQSSNEAARIVDDLAP